MLISPRRLRLLEPKQRGSRGVKQGRLIQIRRNTEARKAGQERELNLSILYLLRDGGVGVCTRWFIVATSSPADKCRLSEVQDTFCFIYLCLF